MSLLQAKVPAIVVSGVTCFGLGIAVGVGAMMLLGYRLEYPTAPLSERAKQKKASYDALMAKGLGKAAPGDVAGVVTYQGKPVVFGAVQFEGKDGTLKQGNIKGDGSYAIAGLPIGEAKAAVNSPPRPELPGWFPIPAEYQNVSQPLLKYTIKSGRNRIDIELK